MAEADREIPEFVVTKDYWLDLEVPYRNFESKWDEEYGNRLRRFVQDDRISSRALNVYYHYIGETLPKNKSIALDRILDEDQEWGLNLLCQYEFSYQKSPDIIKEVIFESDADSTFVDTDLHGTYLNSYERGDKIALLALMQIIEPSLLRNILGLQFCRRRTPRLNATDASVDIDTIISRVDDVVDRMSANDFRQFENWHIFEHGGATYIMIKRQIKDSVERQAGENLEEEPAEFVVLIFEDGVVQIISSNKKIANEARTSLNSSLDVDFELVEPTLSSEEIGESVEEIYSFDHEQLDEDQKEIEGIEDFKIIGIDLSRSPFPGQPSLRMKSEEGIIKTIRALRQMGYDVIENPHNIERVYSEFRDRKYRLVFSEKEDSMDKVIRYYSRYPDEEERAEFERLINELFGIDAVFETS